jgi:hypothetical protein
MPLPEGYLPRKGDEVLIRARAMHDLRPDDDAGGCHFEIIGAEHKSVFLSRDQIYGLHCRKWNEGDRVRVIGEPETVGEIVAARGKYVWIEVDKVDWPMLTFEANELEAEPEQIAVETLTEAELLAGDRLI